VLATLSIHVITVWVAKHSNLWVAKSNFCLEKSNLVSLAPVADLPYPISP